MFFSKKPFCRKYGWIKLFKNTTELNIIICLCSYLLPNHPRGKQKTGVCRKTTSPRWDQTLTWEELSIEDLADRSLELGVWDHDRLGHQDFLGGVRLNLGSGQLPSHMGNVSIFTIL